MQYDNYNSKMQKVARAFRLLLKHMPKIIASGVLLTVTVITLLATKGIVTVSAADKPIDIEYGDEKALIEQYSATAFLSDVKYEYSTVNGDDWTEDFPKEPGDYKVRAVAKATFGHRYGDEAKFTIVKRKISVSILENQMVIYGEDPKVSADLAYGDSFSFIPFEYDEDRTSVEIKRSNIGSFKIEDKEGKDVTSRYEVVLELPEGQDTYRVSIISVQRPIFIETVSAAKVYDGTALAVFGEDGYKLKKDTKPAKGDTIVPEYLAAITDVGTVENRANIKIVNSKGEDVTDKYYKLEVTFGTLTVTKRPITISTDSGVFTYDGTDHMLANLDTSDGGLVVGKHLIEVNAWSSIKNVGSIENRCNVSIIDANGNYVSSNYDISCVWGQLTVNKRKITVSTENVSYEYNSNPQPQNEPDVKPDNLANGEKIVVTGYESLVDVGSVENSVRFYITDGAGDTTSNYEITTSFGTLTVTKKHIDVTSNSYTFTYSGSEQSGDADVDLSVCANDRCDKVITIDPPTDVCTNVVYDFYVIIRNSSGEDITERNYVVNYIKTGTITIKPRDVYIRTNNASKIYDGTALKDTGFTYVYENDLMKQLVNGHRLNVIKSSEQINADSIKNNFEEYEILDAAGNPVDKKNYNIEFTEGWITVEKRHIIITTASAEKVYDGTPLTAPEWKIADNSPYGFVADHTVVSPLPIGSRTEWGSSPNSYDKTKAIIIVDEMITANYDIEVIDEGTLTVKKRPITVKTEGGTFTYDGKDQTPKGVTILGDGICEGQRYTITYLNTFINVNDSGANEVEIEIFDANNDPVTDNYEITPDFGEVIINKRPITIETNGKEYIYDGTVFSDGAIYVTSGDLCEGTQKIRLLEAAPKFQNVSDSGKNIVKFQIGYWYGAEFVDTTENYEITTNYGDVKIKPRPIKVITEGNRIGYAYDPKYEFTYDGTVHFFNHLNMNISEYYSLVNGHGFADIEATAFRNVWQNGEGNNIVTFTIRDATGKDVTANYQYLEHIEYGTITVNKCRVEIKTESQSWTYDGERHWWHNYSCVNGTSFIAIDGITVNEDSASITNVGSCPNNLLFVAADGWNASENYEINIVDVGMLRVDKKQINVTSSDAEKEYDGTPLEKHEITSSGLVNGHKISHADSWGYRIIPGISDNTYDSNTIVITDKDGNPVTDNYEIISATYGTLTVTKRKVYLTSESASKPYDGTPLTAPYVVATEGTTVPNGHEIKATVTGSQTDVGLSDNVYDAEIQIIYNGEDVTEYYDIIERLMGTLKVTPSPIGNGDEDETDDELYVVTADKTGYIYLKRLSYGDYALGKGWMPAVAYNDYIILDNSTQASMYYLSTFAQEAFGATKQSITIESKNGVYVVPYYATTDGTVQISDTVMIGNTDSEYVLYFFDMPYENGMASDKMQEFEQRYRKFVYDNYLTVANETRLFMQDIIEKEGFVLDPNDPYAVIEAVAKYIQGAKKYNLDYDRALNSENNIAVAFLSDKYSEGICQHYATSATMLYRTLGIPARYTVGYAVEITEAGTPTYVTEHDGHAWVEVYIDGYGWLKVEVTGGGAGNGSGNGDGEEPDGPGEEPGENPDDDMIEKEKIDITPVSMAKEYDGTDLVHSQQIEYNSVLERLLEEEYSYEVIVLGTYKDVGSYESEIISFVLFDPYGNPVTDQYDITYNPGKMIITPTAIKIFLRQEIYQYDGTEHEYKNFDKITQLNFKDHTVQITGIKDGFKMIDADEFGVTANDINVDIDKYFDYVILDPDGMPVNKENFGLLVVHIDGSGNDYIVMSVQRRNIVITTESATKEYDEEPLVCNESYISEGSLITDANGKVLHEYSMKILGEQYIVGTSFNSYASDSFRIYDKATGIDVTENYNWRVDFGTLTITEKQ